MKLVRKEIRTGLLVILTMAALGAVFVYLEAPGLFRAQAKYRVFFDNAGGLQEGAPVMLAGRKVGQVIRLSSPVPETERPRPDLQALVLVEVSKGTRLYRNATVSMLQYSLLGQEVIDFTAGSESAGLAEDGAKFIGQRQPGLNDAAPKLTQQLEPVVKAATDTLVDLDKTAKRLTELTEKDADFALAIANFREFGNHLVKLTGTDSSMSRALTQLDSMTSPSSPMASTFRNAEKFTNDLATNKDIDASLQNIRQASANMNTTINGLNSTVKGLSNTVQGIRPGLNKTVHNAAQFTDTIKRQPWRLIWPSTKKYPEDTRAKPPVVAERRTAPPQHPIRAPLPVRQKVPRPAKAPDSLRPRKAAGFPKGAPECKDDIPPPSPDRLNLRDYLRKDP